MISHEQKAAIRNEIEQHQIADRFIQGKYLNGEVKGKYSGCFFGCLTQKDSSDSLTEAAQMMDLPEWLIRLAETIFEGLPQEEAILFPLQFANAWVSAGNLNDTHLNKIYHAYHAEQLSRLLKRQTELYPDDDFGVIAAIKTIFELHQSQTSARSAAWSAARSAAWSVESVESAARSAARSAAWSAESAAWSVESVESAGIEEYRNQRDSLLKAFNNV